MVWLDFDQLVSNSVSYIPLAILDVLIDSRPMKILIQFLKSRDFSGVRQLYKIHLLFINLRNSRKFLRSSSNWFSDQIESCQSILIHTVVPSELIWFITFRYCFLSRLENYDVVKLESTLRNRSYFVSHDFPISLKIGYTFYRGAAIKSFGLGM